MFLPKSIIYESFFPPNNGMIGLGWGDSPLKKLRVSRAFLEFSDPFRGIYPPPEPPKKFAPPWKILAAPYIIGKINY